MMKPLLLAVLLTASVAFGAEPDASFPTRPVKLITGAQTGSGADAEVRQFASELALHLGQSVVVENRPGAVGQIALEALARSPADGYTIGVAQGASISTRALLEPRSTFDPMMELAPLTLLSKHPIVLYASASSGYRTVSELVAAARRKPGGVTYASAGVGSIGHLSGEWFQKLAVIDLAHVPYPSRAAANDLIGGHVDTMFYPPIGMIDHVKTDRIRALAICGPERSSLMPDVPTFAEAGMPSFEAYVWAAAVVPKGVPDAVRSKLAQASIDAVRSTTYRKSIEALGGIVGGETPAEVAEFMRTDRAHWKRIIDASGIAPR